MQKLGYLEIRKKYLDFLISKGHVEIPSAPLVPENDPTVLFTTAGMHPLVPFLLGEKHPAGAKLTNSQRCLRTGDIDEVGDPSHCTSFEMLGNWSLNDYFKKEAINITIDFLVEELGFDINKMYVSVFEGDEDALKDTESIEAWKEIFKKYGIEAKEGDRIQLFPKKNNWWELEAGGPCGPCTEIFYDMGEEKCNDKCNVNCNCGKYLEIGNDVFMEYLKKDGGYSPLGRHNVDFGGGMERTTTIVQGVKSFYEIDIYKPIFELVRSLSKNANLRSQRIVTDHIKAATWIIADGISPARTQQGYILRRLIRRAIRHGRILGIEGLFTRKVGEVSLSQFAPIYSKFGEKREEILNILEEEEIKFSKTLERGLKELDKMLVSQKGKEFTNSNGETFSLYETYGFPLEMVLEELDNRGVRYDKNKVLENDQVSFEKHQEKSRLAAKGFFKGGLADTSEMSTKYHTATHLLLASLHKVLGDHIYQKGSNITPERLRLDFPHNQKVTPEQLRQIEDMVNKTISEALPITFIEMKKEEALKTVKYAAFAEKYSDTVKVYTVGDKKSPFSVEICGGPHVSNTKELGHFKIIKEEAVSAGVRRIKAILE